MEIFYFLSWPIGHLGLFVTLITQADQYVTLVKKFKMALLWFPFIFILFIYLFIYFIFTIMK